MNPPGGAELRIRTRAALLDALGALEEQLEAVIVIGAQALYFHTGDVEVAIPEETKDADLGIDRAVLADDPLLEEALKGAGFHKDIERPQPGRWISRDGIPVDLMIPEAMAGLKRRRSVRVPPHDNGSMRRAEGLEAMVVDEEQVSIGALTPEDDRLYEVRMAGPAALLVAKLHKLGEREADGGERLRDKDAHDLYRLLAAVETRDLTARVERLLGDPISAAATEQALTYLADLFAAGPDALGSRMAGRAEQGVGEPAVVAASVAALAGDLIATFAERR